MTNAEMTILLKTEEGRVELRQALIGKMEEGFALTNTELIFLVALNNIEVQEND